MLGLLKVGTRKFLVWPRAVSAPPPPSRGSVCPPLCVDRLDCGARCVCEPLKGAPRLLPGTVASGGRLCMLFGLAPCPPCCRARMECFRVSLHVRRGLVEERTEQELAAKAFTRQARVQEGALVQGGRKCYKAPTLTRLATRQGGMAPWLCQTRRPA